MAITAPTMRRRTPPLIARALPGRPVRVQWMREQEHAWEPFGPAMVTKLKASLDGNGKIADWNFEVCSNTHSMRPGGAGSMLAAQHMAQPFAVPAPRPLPLPEGGGDRNAIPIYTFSQRARGAPLHSGDAVADFGDAGARRLPQCVFDRELHGRTRSPRRCRSGRIQVETSRRPARPRRDRKGRARVSGGEPARKRRWIAASALPLRGTRIWRPIAPLLPRLR